MPDAAAHDPDPRAVRLGATSWPRLRPPSARPLLLLRDDTDPGERPRRSSSPASPEMPDLPDRSARLQLFGEIARGGMGAVLKGRDVDLGRDLAVKVLLEKHQDKPELVRRFVEEAQIGGQLQHPGVVPVYELGRFADRRPFFTMKLVKGRTLAELLERAARPGRGPAAVPGDLRAGLPDDGLCPRPRRDPPRPEAGEHHGGRFGEVQVMDWGLAKVLPEGGVADEDRGRRGSRRRRRSSPRRGAASDARRSRRPAACGHAAYMAPEQARRGRRVDERADVFGLGAILCES